jgi:hypothetical protein
MARNMIEANSRIFASLKQYISAHGYSPNYRGAQWIPTNSKEKDVLKHSNIDLRLSFGRRRHVLVISHRADRLLVTVGFDFDTNLSGLTQIPLDAGVFTVVVSELMPMVSVSGSDVANAVDWGDGSVPEYKGHPLKQMAALFPDMRAYTLPIASDDEYWRLIFLASVEECAQGESWIDEHLAITLRGLSDLNLLNLPYQGLTRSVFDANPGSLFLALYRCLEATYAFDSCRKVVAKIGKDVAWSELAAALESEVGWHPREAESLAGIFALAPELDLRAVFLALAEPAPTVGADLAAAAAKRVYLLRNALVHYRPGQPVQDFDRVDWNAICEAVAGMLPHIYGEVFPIALAVAAKSTDVPATTAVAQ